MELGVGHAVCEAEAGSFEEAFVGVAAVLMIELMAGVGAVGCGVEGGGFDEPWVTSVAHDTGELSWDDASGIVDKLFGENGGRWEVVSGGREGTRDGCEAGPVLWAGGVGVEAWWEVRAAGEHDLVTGGMIVGVVSERAAD